VDEERLGRQPVAHLAARAPTFALAAHVARTLRRLITVYTLTDGGQTALDIGHKIADFVAPAKESLELALYDLRLHDDTAEVVRGALVGAHERGVNVRLAYNLDRDDQRLPLPPPPKTEPDLVESLPFATAAVPGWPDLMHHKFMVRDRSAVWTGSTNWTDDAWTREENVIVIVESTGVAIRYQEDFAQLWKKRDVQASGRVPTDPIRVDDAEVRTWFSPKRGERLAHRIANAIGGARRRVRIASPVITSGPILGTLAEVAADKKVDLAGVVDATQIDEVFDQWRMNGNNTWKTPSLMFVLRNAAFTGKRSTPYAPGAVHDYMHAKVCVCDDTVFVGSFNLSHSGEENAENVLEIADAALAERMASFVDAIRAKYPPLALDELARVGQRRQHRLDALTKVLVRRRK
jgi:phosphatidylserine/phosphatidylglycerophosphate/cardiolipin synthase-like enzyme